MDGVGTTLDEEVKEMTKPLTKHQQVLQLAAWGWSDLEIAEATLMNINVVNVVRRSPLGASEIERMKKNNGN